jgi:phage shock protein C
MNDYRHPVHHEHRVEPRLWRSIDDKMLAGVIGGLAERTNVGSTALRWIYSIGTVMTGFVPGVVVYVLLWSITSEHSRWRR